MRGLKISFSILVIALFISLVGVSATTSKTYAGVKLPAYNGKVQKGPVIKKKSGIQKYTNEYNINSCTSNYNDVSVRVYSEANGYSSWMTVSKGATSSWANNAKTNKADAYNLQIKNNVLSVCESEHWGVWYLDV